MATHTRRHQGGLTLIEILAAIAIMSAMMVGLAELTNSANESTKQRLAAEQLRQVADAATAYIKANYAAVQGATTPTTKATITIAMLQATNFLSPGFGTTNPWGQATQVDVLQPTPGNLQAAVLTTGGQVIPAREIGTIAVIAGAEGGYVSGPATAQGAKGGWTLDLTNYTQPGVGHLAALLYFNAGQIASDALYRDSVPGQPQLNRMNTNLDAGNNQLVNTQGVQIGNANGTATAGAACTTATLITTDKNTGNLLVCKGGTWQPTSSSALGTASINTPCTPNGSMATNALGNGQILACMMGYWRPLESGAGHWIYYGSFVGSATYYNPYPFDLKVNMWGGAPPCCTNGFSLQAYVNGYQVALDYNNSTSYSKMGFVHFIVPPYTSYIVYSSAYFYGSTQAYLYYYMPY